MSLITEDGTGKTDAESYLSVLDCLAYHNARGNNLWGTITTAQQEQALRRATDYMLGRYREKWKGYRLLTTQALDWPRRAVLIDSNTLVSQTLVPLEIKNACAELAYRASMGPLVEDKGQKVIQETVGPITVKYDPNAPQQVQYSQIDQLLRVYLSMGSNSVMVKLIRC